MTLNAVTLLLALFAFVSARAELGEDCVTYDKSPGSCVPLTKCQSLFSLVSKPMLFGQMTHQQAIEIIRRSACGFDLMEPLVCCAKPKPYSGSNEVQASQEKPLGIPKPADSHDAQGFATTPVSPTAPTDPAELNAGSTKLPVPTNESSESTEVRLTNVTEELAKNPNLLPENCGRVVNFKYFQGNLTEFDDFPWITLVEYKTPMGPRFACGGALINQRYVLTAARCVKNIDPTWKITGVRFGEYDLSSKRDCMDDGGGDVFCMDEPVDVAVEEAIVHPGFIRDDPSRLHDIALLRLANNATFSYYVRPICLPFKIPDPQRYYTSGWGITPEYTGTDLKYMSYLSLASQDSCAAQYKSKGVVLANSQICAGLESKQEKSCIGDLGTPLMGIEEKDNLQKRVTVFGLLSMNPSENGPCEKSLGPGVYTKIQDYVPWIISQLRD